MSETQEKYGDFEAVLEATEAPQHTEAPVVVFSKIMHPAYGLVMSPTFRGDNIGDVWNLAGAFLIGKLDDGWIPVQCRDAREALAQHKRHAGNGAGNGAGQQQDGPQSFDDVPEIPYPQQPAPEQQSDGPMKTSAIEKIVVTDGQLQVYVAGLQWPLKDSRLKAYPDLVAGYFDGDTGFDAQALGQDGTYKPDGLLCDYAKEGKYWNIKRVRTV